MKNQKDCRRQLRLKTGQLATGAWLIQLDAPGVARPFVPARKIPVVFHSGLEESLAIKHIAPAYFSAWR
jgi:hypothetical protein